MADIVLGSKQTARSLLRDNLKECRAYAERMGYNIVGEYIKMNTDRNKRCNRADFQKNDRRQ